MVLWTGRGWVWHLIRIEKLKREEIRSEPIPLKTKTNKQTNKHRSKNNNGDKTLLVKFHIFVSVTTYIAGEMSLINIRSAMEEWQNKLCITFKERKCEEDYIEFTYEGGYA